MSFSYAVFFMCVIVLMMVFIIRLIRTQNIMMIHKFYFASAISVIVWLFAILAVSYTPPDNVGRLMFWDCISTACAAVIPPCSLLFVISYIEGYEKKMPKRFFLVFAVPLLTIILVSTNQYHHLYYKVFSLENTTVRFGAYFWVHSIYTYSCVALAVTLMIAFALQTKNRLHILQAALFTIGSMVPSIMNILGVTHMIKANILVTPLSFAVTMVFHGIIIYRMHLLDIRPIAMQQLINLIGDCYLVTNENGLIVSYNKQFKEIFGSKFQPLDSMTIQDAARSPDIENKTAIMNLMTAIRSCADSNERVTYEQVIYGKKDGEAFQKYYMAEVTPLVMKSEVCGFLSILKDVTQIKVNMQRLQDNQVKMMEQERLAFLGQMVGGMAHNLKTPIMSISGSVVAVQKLTNEAEMSIGDPEVTDDDFREIYQEMDGWLERVREACAYMSEIITAVKGQASSMNVAVKSWFSLNDALKRVSLLLRHELLQGNCALVIKSDWDVGGILVNGDINSLVQVLNNLISNAIDARLPDGNHEINIDIDNKGGALQILVTDHGSGIPENVKKKLFQEMVTSKGAKGSGLGIFISNTLIHTNFDGAMWYKDNPAGGTIWGISIPAEAVKWSDKKVDANEEE